MKTGLQTQFSLTDDHDLRALLQMLTEHVEDMVYWEGATGSEHRDVIAWVHGIELRKNSRGYFGKGSTGNPETAPDFLGTDGAVGGPDWKSLGAALFQFSKTGCCMLRIRTDNGELRIWKKEAGEYGVEAVGFPL